MIPDSAAAMKECATRSDTLERTSLYGTNDDGAEGRSKDAYRAGATEGDR